VAVDVAPKYPDPKAKNSNDPGSTDAPVTPFIRERLIPSPGKKEIVVDPNIKL